VTAENPAGREGHSLAAGLALGLIALGRGASAPALAELRINEHLNLFISGGRYSSLNASTAPEAARRAGVGRPDSMHGAASGMRASAGDAAASKNSTIKEDDLVNLDVTAPGAMLALALMYLQTNNEQAARLLDLPTSLPELEELRPDLVVIRVWARGLIMWDEVQPTPEWMLSQIPAALIRLYDPREQAAAAARGVDVAALAMLRESIEAGLCFVWGFRFAGSAVRLGL